MFPAPVLAAGDGWIHNITTNCWKQLRHLPYTRPRLWHTACLGKENEIMVFGGSKDNLLFLDTGHCNDLLIFQTQPYSLLRSCLDCIGKNAIILKSQISLLPPKLLQQVLKKITFWTAANYRKEQRIRKEETENNQPRVSSCWALQVQCGCVLASDHTSHPPLQWRLDLRTQWETHVWLMWLHGTGDMEIRCS